MKLSAHTDGACRGNPGPAGIGFTIERDTRIIEENYRFIGDSTNNIAEYTAMIDALTRMNELGADEIDIFSDSELIVNQINGSYKVKNQGLLPLYTEVIRLSGNFRKITVTYIPRESNKSADKLANTAIDKKDSQRRTVENQPGNPTK
jgi:ribonuclease HI